MAHAETCPICLGKGVIHGICDTGANPNTTCNGCNGRGWIEVSDEPASTFPWPEPDFSEIQHLLSDKPLRFNR